MNKPWQAEKFVSPEAAIALIETQFPALRPVLVKPLGKGWDNSAYIVNDSKVFRFPRREIAVDLIATESRILPAIAALLPLPVPVPEWIGSPTKEYPWPFAGYLMLSGGELCRAALSTAQRAQAAETLASFLKCLHTLPRELAQRHELPPDLLRRLDPELRIPRLESLMDSAKKSGLVTDLVPLEKIIADTPRDLPGTANNGIVHGDFHVRNILVDAQGRISGVIDWGDVHYGNPAIDLTIAHSLLPPTARERFRKIYGDIDPDTWLLACFRALYSVLMLLSYGNETGDSDLVRESQIGLQYVLQR